MADQGGKIFNRDIRLAKGCAIYVNDVLVVDGDGNIDAPVTTTDLTTTGNTTLGNGSGDTTTVSGDLLFVKEVNHTFKVNATTTAATAGGNLAIAGGAGSTTGAGGTASVTAGAGGNDAVGGAASLVGGAAGGGNRAGGAALVTAGAGAGSAAGGAVTATAGQGGATGLGGDASLIAGAGGATSGDGGDAKVTGGAATANNDDGGDVVLTPGAAHGSGIAGVIIDRGLKLVAQGAPAAKTVSATLTAAELKTGIITVNQAAGASSAQQLPTAADLDTALPSSAAGDAFDFSVINTSTVDAEDASVTTNTGWTLVGSMDVHAYSAAGSLNSSARFRARKTGTAAWTLYRIA